MAPGVGGSPSSEARAALVERLGVTFRDESLLDNALVHRSYAYERGITETNERLELLGDAVLSLVVTDMLFRRFPHYLEGDLAKLRASLVSAPALAEVARELTVGDAVLLGRGEELTGGRDKPSILADTLEAVLGAVYVDRGITASRQVINRLFGGRIRSAVGREVPKDAKTRLQEYVTRLRSELPRYRVHGVGPDHEKVFTAEVFVGGERYGTGEGRSKKEAEQSAASQAVRRLLLEAEDAREGAAADA